LGFASCRVLGHFAVHPGGLDTALPDHQPPEPFAANGVGRGDFLSARGFATLLPVTPKSGELLAARS
jgi:hypothetical protein